MDIIPPIDRPTDAQLHAVGEANAARGQVIGELQTHLADLIDPVMEARREMIAAAVKDMTKQVKTIARNRTKGVNYVVGGMAELGGELNAARALQVFRAGQAAATGQMQLPPELLDLIPPDPPPMTPPALPPGGPPVGPGAPRMAPSGTPMPTGPVGGRACPPGQTYNQQAQECVFQSSPAGATPPLSQPTSEPAVPPRQPAPAAPPLSPLAPFTPASGPVIAPSAPAGPGEAALPVSPPAQAPPAEVLNLQPAGCPDVTVILPKADNFCVWIKALANQVVTWGEAILGTMADGRTSGHITAGTIHGVVKWLVGTDADTEEITPLLANAIESSDWYLQLDRWNCLIDAYGLQAGSDVRAALAFRAALQSWQDLTVGSSHSEGASVGESSSWGLKALSLGAAVEKSASASKGLSVAIKISAAVVPAVELVEQVIRYLLPTGIPGAGEAIDAYLTNHLSGENAACIMRANGVRDDLQQALVMSRRTKIADSQRMEWGYRNGESYDSMYQGLREYGYIVDIDTVRRLEMYFDTPAVGDIERWADRQLNNPAVVDQYQLDSGFVAQLWGTYSPLLLANGVRQDWAQLNWQAHWTMPAEGQLQEWLHRLGPDGSGTGVTFSDQDYQAFLSMSGYNPWAIARMMAVRYQPVSIRQLRQGLDTGALRKADALVTLRAMGLAPDVAERVADSELILSARRTARQNGTWTLEEAVKAIHSGLFTVDQFVPTLAAQGYDRGAILGAYTTFSDEYIAGLESKSRDDAVKDYVRETKGAYEGGAVDRPTANAALLSAGYTAQAAQLELDSIDYKVRQQTLKEAVAAVHRAFTQGAVPIAGATAALVQSGMTPDRAGVMAQRWTLEMSPGRVGASAAMLRQWTRKGLISIANFRVRLHNLGWADDALALEILELEQELQQAAAKAASGRAKELAQAQNMAKKALAATQKRMCSIYTPARLQKWYVLGRIDQKSVRDRLGQCGYDKEAIDNLLAEMDAAKEKYTASGGKAKPIGAPRAKQPGKLLSGAALKRLYVEDIIDGPKLRAGLAAIGYDESEIRELAADADLAKAGKKAKAPAGASANGRAVQSPGSGASG